MWVISALLLNKGEHPRCEMGWGLNEGADSGRAGAWNCHPALPVDVRAVSSAAEATGVIEHLGNAGSAPHQELRPSIMWNLPIPHLTPLPPPLNTDLPLISLSHSYLSPPAISGVTSRSFFPSSPLSLIPDKALVAVTQETQRYRCDEAFCCHKWTKQVPFCCREKQHPILRAFHGTPLWVTVGIWKFEHLQKKQK